MTLAKALSYMSSAGHGVRRVGRCLSAMTPQIDSIVFLFLHTKERVLA